MGVTFSVFDLSVAGLLVICAAAASWALSLGVHRQLLWAAGRLIAQLLLVGLVLRALFASESMLLGLGLVVLMVGAAIYETAARPQQRMAGRFNAVASAAGIGASVMLIVVLAGATLRHDQDVLQPRVLVPIAGIVLGTAMTAASLALNTLLDNLRRERLAIEAQLALGVGRFRALAPVVRGALHNGIIPTLNQMAGAGIITLPGLMSGQVLAGADPVQAAYTQIFLSLLLSVAALISAAGVVGVAILRLTDHRDRLRLDRF
ncbi:ABC transporter permease [Ketogulonicigenium vulgare]|uniref:ABC-type transport system, permease component n=1 Tax=Ketogulonicigenium vulgare (strain WSH-001) TaxID=759362 RepID=F9Y750_KETVW|nr:ABC transporter permease [Ketogulonicigenium vulgare]AEM42240.1 ABC-type transport system, permease component [Ketogulonicigenium vulgare WSH-001]ALJ79860.1 ABC transporter permease [Ketogulonicigenium vulgare]ANW32766.1 ABC transporter permease [Ketogulonicigenium vulgare]AOZ53073.1 ABC-type transport system, permease component [Ketogulonicigenium vulgare]